MAGIAHHLAGLPGPAPEWAILRGRHPYQHGPFMAHHHPHFSHYMFAALDRPINTSPRLMNEPSSTSLGPISVNCSNTQSTSPKTSPNLQVGLLTTAEEPQSPQEDDISVTASPTPSPPAPPAFPGIPPPPMQNHQLFNNALAASLFLNAPLLPPHSQWFYSSLYPHDWNWMNLRNSQIAKSSPQEEVAQNPDSSSEKLGAIVTETDDETNSAKPSSKDRCSESNMSPKNSINCEGINLSLRVRKAAITLVRQRDDVMSCEKDNVKSSRESNRHVWRPY